MCSHGLNAWRLLPWWCTGAVTNNNNNNDYHAFINSLPNNSFKWAFNSKFSVPTSLSIIGLNQESYVSCTSTDSRRSEARTDHSSFNVLAWLTDRPTDWWLVFINCKLLAYSLLDRYLFNWILKPCIWYICPSFLFNLAFQFPKIKPLPYLAGIGACRLVLDSCRVVGI